MMKIFLVCNNNQQTEFEKWVGQNATLTIREKLQVSDMAQINTHHVFIHAFADDEVDLTALSHCKIPVMLNAVKKTLSSICSGILLETKVAGVNFIPTFINRKIIEMCFLKNEEQTEFDFFARQLGVQIETVLDHPGMVTPRIICMIINEAAQELEEQTATIDAIDIAMKLGTAYPMGPFEWANKMGVKNVFEILMAMQNSDSNSHYQICNLIREKAEANSQFE